MAEDDDYYVLRPEKTFFIYVTLSAASGTGIPLGPIQITGFVGGFGYNRRLKVPTIENVAAFPLAIPLMAGPGAITASVLLSGRADHDPRRIALLLGVIVVVTAACWLCFAIATPIAKVIGTTGNTVLQRLLGVLLAALGA